MSGELASGQRVESERRGSAPSERPRLTAGLNPAARQPPFGSFIGSLCAPCLVEMNEELPPETPVDKPAQALIADGCMRLREHGQGWPSWRRPHSSIYDVPQGGG